jgi:hypothetical protein
LLHIRLGWDHTEPAAQLSPRSIVPVLDAILTTQWEPPTKIGSHSAPKIGHQSDSARGEEHKWALT